MKLLEDGEKKVAGWFMDVECCGTEHHPGCGATLRICIGDLKAMRDAKTAMSVVFCVCPQCKTDNKVMAPPYIAHRVIRNYMLSELWHD